MSYVSVQKIEYSLNLSFNHFITDRDRQTQLFFQTASLVKIPLQ